MGCVHDVRGADDALLVVREAWIEVVAGAEVAPGMPPSAEASVTGEGDGFDGSTAPAPHDAADGASHAEGAPQAVTYRIQLRLDGHLDVRRRLPAGAYRVTREDVELPVLSRWDPVDRRVTLQFRALPGGVFEVTPDPERLPTRTGVAVDAEPIRLPASAAVAAPESRPPVSWARELREPLEAACGGCHGAPGFSGPAITPEGLRWQRSVHEPDRFLVEPYEPARSIALLVMLPHVPMREGRRKPPPWSSAEPLDPGLLRAFADWIEAGAPVGDPMVDGSSGLP